MTGDKAQLVERAANFFETEDFENSIEAIGIRRPHQ